MCFCILSYDRAQVFFPADRAPLESLVMENCVDCYKFVSSEGECSVKGCSPIRRCVIASLEKRFKGKSVGVVADVGCGGWSYPRDLILDGGNTWFGVDPSPDPSSPHGVDAGDASIRTHDGTVDSLPFENGEIDLVLCNQSMEHWHEYGTSFTAGLVEINRVLKAGGAVVLNMPVHYHGHPIFVKGQIGVLKELFKTSLWSQVDLNFWGKFRGPDNHYRGWENTTLHPFDRSMLNNPPPENSWMLEIVAKKSHVSKIGIGDYLRMKAVDQYCSLLYWTCRFSYRLGKKLKRL